MRNVYLATAAAAALCFGNSEAHAQTSEEPSATKLDEIVVTARKRSERLFDIPNAITAVSAEQIETQRLQDARDLITLVPTAFLQENNAGTARDFNIRGVGTPNLFAEAGVATYVDEVYASGFISYPTQFHDIARVEVLRGPQGALYGRNAVGGAVNVISQTPQAELGGFLSGTYGDYNRIELEGALNLPLGDMAALRLAGWRTEQTEGEYFNTTTQRTVDTTDVQGSRLSLSLNPFEAFKLTLIAEQTDADTPGTYLYFPTAGETKRTLARDTQPVNNYETSRLSANATWSTEAGALTLVAGHRTYELNGVEDTDLSADFTPTANAPSGKQVTTRANEVESDYLEVRWASRADDRFNYLLGFNLLQETARGDILTDLAFFSVALAAPAALGINNDQSVDSWAAFAQADYSVTETLTLTADLRFTDDEKTVDFAFRPTAVLAPFGLVPQTTQRTTSFDNWSPGVTLAWAPNQDWRAYAKVQSGFRAGGYNFNVGSIANLPYEQETSINYEVGLKRVLGGRGYIGATAYLLEQDDVLVPQFDLTVPGPLGGYLANAGEARTLGLELEAQFTLIDDLTVGAAVGLLDAEFTSGVAAFGASIKGNEPPSARDLTLALTAAYRRPIGSGIDLVANGAYTYRSDGFADVANNVPLEAASLLNASIGLDFQERFTILAFVQNATDDDYVIAQGGSRGAAFGEIRAPGRTYGLTVRASF